LAINTGRGKAALRLQCNQKDEELATLKRNMASLRTHVREDAPDEVLKYLGGEKHETLADFIESKINYTALVN
jgi:hypothetical protein